MKKIKTPETICLADATDHIDLRNMPFIRALKELLRYSEEYKLPIYFNNEVYGYDINEPLEIIKNEQDEMTSERLIQHAIPFQKNKTLARLTGSGCYRENQKYFIYVNSFRYDGIDYKTANESQEYLEQQSFSLDCFHINIEELNAFMHKIKLVKRDFTFDEPKRKKGNQSTQHKREDGFKIWLAAKADNEISSEFTYQHCYEQIGSPTQKDLWAMLQKSDKKLFSANMPDFFKNQNIIIFQPGTGKNRGSQ